MSGTSADHGPSDADVARMRETSFADGLHISDLGIRSIEIHGSTA
jgi:hypothetical protein